MMMTVYFRYLLFVIALFKKIECKGELKTLNESTWYDMLEGEWMVEFFAPWCPACQQLQPIWEEFAKWSDDLGIKIGNVDVTVNPGLSGRFMITALPTIFHVKDGVFRQYRGSRDKDSFMYFVEEKKWQSLEPVSGWKSPDSIPMYIVSFFFKLSMQLRSLHTVFVEDYGIPYWGSYIIFGVVTIFIGAFLGLLIVCVLDYFCHSKDASPTPLDPNARKEERRNEGFEDEDVIRNDDGDSEDSVLRRRRDTTD